MKIFNYSNFLLESGKGLSDLKIFYSDDFREILLSMVSTISDKGVYSIVRKLLEAEDNSDKLDSYTLIDKTDKNDMISYVQSNRIIRDKGVDNDTIKGFIQVYRPTGDKHWKQGRVAAYSIGRWVRHIFVDVFKETITPMYPKRPRLRLDDSPVVAYDFNMKSPNTSKSESIPILKRLI